MSDLETFFNHAMQSGSGAPDPAVGVDDDRYLNTSPGAGAGDFYVKESGVWVLKASFGGLKPVLLATATVGETVGLAVSLGVRRYTVAVAGAATGDRLVLALTGAPSNGTVQDAYVSSPGNVSVGILTPALGINATISVPVAIYKFA